MSTEGNVGPNRRRKGLIVFAGIFVAAVLLIVITADMLFKSSVREPRDAASPGSVTSAANSPRRSASAPLAGRTP